MSLYDNNVATAVFGGNIILGTYSTDGNMITVLDPDCGAGVEGNYSYSVTSSSLTLTLINDDCGGGEGSRPEFIADESTATWTKSD